MQFKSDSMWQIIKAREGEGRKRKKRKDNEKHVEFRLRVVYESIIFTFLSFYLISNWTDLQRILSVRLPMRVVMMPLIMLLLVLRVVLITLLLVLLRWDRLQNVIGSLLRDELLTRTIHRIHCQAWILYHSVGSLCTVRKRGEYHPGFVSLDALCIHSTRYARQCLLDNPFKGVL